MNESEPALPEPTSIAPPPGDPPPGRPSPDTPLAPPAPAEHRTPWHGAAVGRIVHYWPLLVGNLKGQPYAAVITHVWSEGVVNLHLINDGSFGLQESEVLKTNVSFTLFDTPGCWTWPPRV